MKRLGKTLGPLLLAGVAFASPATAQNIGTITKLSHYVIPAGSPTVITISGIEFNTTVNSYELHLAGDAYAVHFVSSKELYVIVTPDSWDIDVYGFQLCQKIPGSCTSALGFEICKWLTTNTLYIAIGPPTPKLNSVSPNIVVPSPLGLGLQVSGDDFCHSSIVRFDGDNLPTSYISPTKLHAEVPPGGIAVAGSSHTVTVFSPGAPGSGMSNSKPLLVDTYQPKITQQPQNQSICAGQPAVFSVTAQAAQLFYQWRKDGKNIPGATAATYLISSVTPAAVGTYTVVVTNTCASIVSDPATLTMIGPFLESINPAAAGTGSGPLKVLLSGTNFTPSTIALWNDAPLPAVVLDASHIEATVPSALLALAGTAALTVADASTSCGASPAVTFTISNPVPVLSQIYPTSVPAGSPTFTLVLEGQAFAPSCTVVWKGSLLPIEFASPTRIAAEVNAVLIVAEGSVQVTVVNPAPGGGASNVQTFAIGPPVPVVANGFALELVAENLPDTMAGMAIAPSGFGPWAGHVFVADEPSKASQNGRILRVDPSGAWTVFASPSSLLGRPRWLEFAPGGPFGTDLYASPTGDRPLRIVDGNGLVSHFGDIQGHADLGRGLAFSAGGLFGTYVYTVSDSDTLLKIAPDENSEKSISLTLQPGDLAFGPGVAGFDGSLYFGVAKPLHGSNPVAGIYALDAQLNVSTFTELDDPRGLAFGQGGAFGYDLFVAESSGRIVRINGTGAASDLVSGLDSAYGIAFDTNAALYLSDPQRQRLYRVVVDPCPASWRNYGAGWPGSNGIPVLEATSDPELGGTTFLILGNSSGFTTPSLLILGAQKTTIPVPGGGTLLVGSGIPVQLPVPAEGLLLRFDVPADPALCGLTVYTQLLVSDPGASNGMALSRGLEIGLGH